MSVCGRHTHVSHATDQRVMSREKGAPVGWCVLFAVWWWGLLLAVVSCWLRSVLVCGLVLILSPVAKAVFVRLVSILSPTKLS